MIELDENKVWFDGLTIERMGDELIYHLSLTGNGQRTIEEFRFKRKAL
ncbi:hypothetical protein [Algoriphagus boritolerans]